MLHLYRARRDSGGVLTQSPEIRRRIREKVYSAKTNRDACLLQDKQRRNSRIALFAKVSIIINAAISLGKIGMSIYFLSFFCS
jgi:hypothetical protein